MRHFLLVAGLGFCIVSSASADDIAVSEQTFGCILDWPQVRNTRIKHSDPEQLKEAMRIFRDSIPDTAYPVGTILQLVPFEAMVKHPRDKFPKTNGWAFFALDVFGAGTSIRAPADNVVNLSQEVTYLSLHLPAAWRDSAVAAAPPRLRVVGGAYVREEDVRSTLECVGRLVGCINAQIGGRGRGHLMSQTYQEGLPVKAGGCRFQVDPRAVQVAL